VKLPSNKSVALQRIHPLKKRLESDSEYRVEYVSFVEDLLSKGYAESVPSNAVQGTPGQVWYLPHHGVRHPQKRKLRVVFDCSASYLGSSLNAQLLQGPNLTSTLNGVLI
jgi:hypothetical protein